MRLFVRIGGVAWGAFGFTVMTVIGRSPADTPHPHLLPLAIGVAVLAVLVAFFLRKT